MLAAFVDPFDTLLNLQRELEARLSSDWLENVTTARGPFLPINVFALGNRFGTAIGTFKGECQRTKHLTLLVR
jgi:hypothetical protein